jgi:hypothetical protein
MSPSVAADRFPTWKHILLIFAGMVVLGLSACFGFLATLNFNTGDSPISIVFGVLFFLAVLAVLVDMVFVVWRIIRGQMNAPPSQDPP